MKCLLLIVCVSGLCLNTTFAQTSIEASQSRSFSGHVVHLTDYVWAINVVSSSRVYVTIGRGIPDSSVTVVLLGKGARKNALRLKIRMVADVNGRMKIINGSPQITITDFRHLKMSNCTCMIADKNTDIEVDTVNFPAEKQMYKQNGVH